MATSGLLSSTGSPFCFFRTKIQAGINLAAYFTKILRLLLRFIFQPKYLPIGVVSCALKECVPSSMTSGRLDLFIAKLPIHTIVLTLNCSDSDSELLTIPRNAPLYLVRGKIKQAIQLQFLEGRECFADFMEMNYALARQFQLNALRRYLLTYNPDDQTLTVKPSPLSETTANLSSSLISSGTLCVGYELLSRLGIPERQGKLIKVRQGKNLARFRLLVPANLSDDRLRLPSNWLQKWKLTANNPLLLQYDQRSSTLSLTPPNNSSR
jgi:hypothetical protein